MRQHSLTIRHVSILVLVMFLSIAMTAVAIAQSQEPKPNLPATPTAESASPGGELPSTGVSGSSWRGPNWGVSLTWDPSLWTVEGEFIDTGYDGLQIGTPISTVYIEAYEGFGGDADACFADAEREIGEREGISEVVPLSDRPLPVPEDVRGVAQFLGLTATLSDGSVYRGVEYVECRSLVPGQAVLEITWQTATGGFNEDFARVEALLAALVVPADAGAAATPSAPSATPIA